MKVDVLVFAAHPDDAELNCGGTIAALVAQGKSAGVVDMTQGEMGTRGTIESREFEANTASKVLGLAYRVNLNLGDSYVENTRQNQLKIIEQVRKCRPHICILGALPIDIQTTVKLLNFVLMLCFTQAYPRSKQKVRMNHGDQSTFYITCKIDLLNLILYLISQNIGKQKRKLF